MTSDDEYADRLREVLRAEADAVVPAGDGLARIQARTERKTARQRWLRPLAVVAGASAIAAGVAIGFALTGSDDTRLHQNPPPPAASATQPPPKSAAPSPQPLPAQPVAMRLPVGLPLWPFADAASASANAASWTSDPSQTASRFTTLHLGFTDDNLVLSTTKSSDGQQAWVSVGYRTEGPRTATAAVVHLARWSNNGPWEVVGTRDSTLSLTQPSYGATANSPVTAGGTITGVDESIRVAVHQPSTSQPLGVACCTPAGGTSSPWSEKVTYKSSSASTLTIVASTGGHVTQHERWAITAVRNRSDTSTTPSTFVAAKNDGIGLFRTSNGGLVRWIVAQKTGAADPRVVGGTVYYMSSVNCSNSVMRVPYTGGKSVLVYHESGATILGHDETSGGALAVTELRCSDNARRIYVHDPASGRTNATPYQPGPPEADNPAWAPDGKRLAVVVVTGTKAQVRVLDAYNTSSVVSGSVGCEDNGNAGLFTNVAYWGNTLFAGYQTGHGMAVGTCAAGAVHTLFSTGATALNSLDVDAAGDVITELSQGSSTGDVLIWSNGHAHHVNVGTCHGIKPQDQTQCLYDPTWA